MRNERKFSAVRARRISVAGKKTPRVFILGETVTVPPVPPNDGTCNPTFVLRFNDRPALRSWCRGARR